MDPIKLYKRNESPFWQAQIVVAADKTLRISTRESDETKAYQIAYKRYIEAKTRYDMGIRDEAITFGQAFSAWPGRQHSKNHQTYLCWLQRQWGARLLGEIQTAELNRWFSGLTLGSSRKGDIARIIRGVYAHAMQNKQITLDAVPQIKIPADPENPRPHFTDDELERILSMLPHWRSDKDDRKAVILRYVVELMAGTGIRPGRECQLLRWTDFQIWGVGNGKPRYKLRIRPETNKTRRGREVVMGAATADLIDGKLRFQLMDWKCFSQTGFLFCTEPDQPVDDLDKLFAQFLTECGLAFNDLGRKRTLYSIRHSYCTQKLIKGVPPHILAKQTGHEPKVLLKWYSKATPTDWADILTAH